MEELLAPTLDLVFKLIFTKDKELLIDLINSVLQLPEEKRIQTVEVKNPNILPEDIRKKFIILDIRAYDPDNHQYNIEMQAKKYDCYPKRALFYLTKLHSNRLGVGELL